MKDKFYKICEEYNFAYQKAIQSCFKILNEVFQERDSINLNKQIHFTKTDFDVDFNGISTITTIEKDNVFIFYNSENENEEQYFFEDIPTNIFFQIMKQIVENEFY